MKTTCILPIICCLLIACQEGRTIAEEPSGDLTALQDSAFAALPFCHQFGIPLLDYEVEDDEIKRNENFASILQSRGVDYSVIHELTQNATGVFDMRKLRAGNKYTILYLPESGEAAYMIYEENERMHICFALRDSLGVSMYEIPVTIEERYAEVVISVSLWEDLEKAGYNPLIANSLSEVYAWTVDFFGLQKGDAFKVYYLANILEGKETEPGRIVAASFTRSGKTQMAFRYVQDSITGYWDIEGENLQKAFLKAPLRYSRVSSGFSYARRHPITRTVRPHTGVDYAAPAGTPVLSIGDGVVTERKYAGGGGNTVRIKHNSVYTTAYLHLSRFAKGLSVGKRVSQGEVIGYVGSTGSSTGPHLDFRVWKNGKPINPLKMESPPAEPVKAENKADFYQKTAYYKRSLMPGFYKSLAFQIIQKAGVKFL